MLLTSSAGVVDIWQLNLDITVAADVLAPGSARHQQVLNVMLKLIGVQRFFGY